MDEKFIDEDGQEQWFDERLTEIQRTAIATRATAIRMERQDISNRVQALLRELPREHLETLRIMLDMMMRNPTLCTYHLGAVVTSLALRFDAFDSTKGLDAELARMTERAAEPRAASPEPEPAPEPAPEPEPAPTEPPVVHPALRGFEDEAAPPPARPAPPATTQQLRDDPDAALSLTMARYNVEPTGEGDEVRCLGCGHTYVSLGDRMVKATDDCHFCHIKSAWGGASSEPMAPPPSPFRQKDDER